MARAGTPNFQGRRGLLALSLANLCFASAWQRRIYGVPFFAPLWSWRDLGALTLNITVLAVCLYFLLWLAETKTIRGHRWDGLVYSIPLFSVLNLVRRAVFPFQDGRMTAVAMMAVPLFLV